MPSFSNQPIGGKVIKQEDVEFIVSGKTTRDELVQGLGSEYRSSPRMPVLAYAWELPGGTAVWWWFVVVPPSGTGDVGDHEWSRWRAFFVLLDDKNVVVEKKFVHLRSKVPLDEQLENWGAETRRKYRSL